MSRYRVENRRGFNRVGLMCVRARLTDEQTGGVAEFESCELADETAELLDREDKAQLPAKPEDASPFPTFSTSHGHEGSVFIQRGEGAIVDGPTVAVSKDEKLAMRIARVLSHAHVRPRRAWRGPVKSRYF